MKLQSTLVAIAALAALLSWPLAHAQASAPTRAQVKAETRAAEKGGTLTPAGEATAPVVAPPVPSGPKLTRAQRKAATLQARKAGQLAPAGVTQRADIADQRAPATRTRADRKAETRAARRSGELVPAGEGSPGQVKK